MFFIKKENLIGQKFGKLTVIEETINPNSKSKKVFWKCRCECGDESTIVDTASLKSGSRIHCSKCSRIQAGLKRRKQNVLGQRFGKLVVIDIQYGVIKSGRQRTYCTCKCDCGKEVSRTLESLKAEKLCSCGCARKEIADNLSINIIGNTYGRLTVISELKDKTPREVICNCSCGKKGIIFKKTDVMSMHTQSCGCLQSERASINNIKDWSGYISDYGIKMIEQAYKNEHGTWIWKCKCHCGNIFNCLPADIITGKRRSCGCVNKSFGEQDIENILLKYNFDYKYQYSFPDCIDILPLPFDFGIKIINKLYLIEYDGKQYTEVIEFFGGEEEFIKRQEHDKIKNEYCTNNNIPLLRIDYTKNKDEMEKMIIDFLTP